MGVSVLRPTGPPAGAPVQPKQQLFVGLWCLHHSKLATQHSIHKHKTHICHAHTALSLYTSAMHMRLSHMPSACCDAVVTRHAFRRCHTQPQNAPCCNNKHRQLLAATLALVCKVILTHLLSNTYSTTPAKPFFPSTNAGWLAVDMGCIEVEAVPPLCHRKTQHTMCISACNQLQTASYIGQT